MRYAVFTDIHANLEALEAVLAKIDVLAQQEPIDQLWFLGDLVGYGPNPNECIIKLRERTSIVIAGNHDWAAVGKIDLEDFSAAARISAEWTAEQLTEEHREFLTNLPERIVLRDCTLVHGSPYGPLWEYLTSEVLAERSFQYFTNRYCFVGHTHVPVIFQQPDPVAQTPTIPLTDAEQCEAIAASENELDVLSDDDEETQKVAAVRSALQISQETSLEGVRVESEQSTVNGTQPISEPLENGIAANKDTAEELALIPQEHMKTQTTVDQNGETGNSNESGLEQSNSSHVRHHYEQTSSSAKLTQEDASADTQELTHKGYTKDEVLSREDEVSQEERIANAEDRINSEIEELLALLGLSQSMVQVTNEMIVPPEGPWTAPKDYRAIVNPGGVGQPRDGDPRAAFMIYDTERGFTFYRVHYDYEKTQEKIIKAGLPPYLAARLGYGR